ncbi:MAG: flagellar biosynthesis protein FlhA [Chthonomonas sp.]|nr:flagellar biosynthesis protein FlhA [Chthonomonas sp.]
MPTIQKLLRQTDLLIGAALLVVVAMLILPLPHWILDLGLVAAIASSVVILLSAVNVDDPLKMSVFPSLLLLTTLFRLALSIAATKLILGSGTAGAVIETFGNFVMGGDFIVGFIAFLILMIVQFMVITNGSGRVSEVVARFTLDAMPGKQMAIDADLAAGMIDETQARERRKNVKREADFYGAMDGASKFVKGDAVASILIIIVNIVGGFAMGFMRGDGDAMTILKTYALLSVGEGLVSQIPALLISTASGLLVTRAGQERGMGGEVLSQVLGQPKALLSGAGALAVFAFIPGFPATIFLGMAAALFGAYKFATKNPDLTQVLKTDEEKRAEIDAQAQQVAQAQPTGPEAVLPLLQVDALEIEIGHGLTRLADTRAGGDLPDRIGASRREIAMELGFVMPSVRIRDNINLGPNEYCIKVRGEEIGRARIEPSMLLAMKGGSDNPPLVGIPTKEPVFGLEAYWIDRGHAEDAKMSGYTVVEPNIMISTHLTEIVKTHAPELLTRQDVNTLLDQAKVQNPTVVNELVPSVVKVGDVQKVLRHLLRERVPIRDMVTILETMSDYADRVKDFDSMGELVRAEICRTVTRQNMDGDKLFCLTLDAHVEDVLNGALQNTTLGSVLVLNAQMREQLFTALRAETDKAMMMGNQPVLLASNMVRLPLRRFIEHEFPFLQVMAYNEVASKVDVELLGSIRFAEQFAA